MTPEVILSDAVAAASGIVPISTIRGYVFGSVLKADARWSDIDILIVCDDGVDVPRVRPALARVSDMAPIDLLVMTSHEERQLNFIAEQHCLLLFELSAGAGLSYSADLSQLAHHALRNKR